MDPFQFFYSLPVIGLVFEFIGYLVHILPVIAPIVMKASVPIGDRKSTRLNSSHVSQSRMPSSA